MEQQIIEIPRTAWGLEVSAKPGRHARVTEPKGAQAEQIKALEAGKILYFPQLGFKLSQHEQRFLTQEIRDPNVRNISLDADGGIKGALCDAADLQDLAVMITRFRSDATALIASLAPRYVAGLRLAPTSFRPTRVEGRVQSWRADDRRLHVDAFPSRPNCGERILRVFTNLNLRGEPRVWRVGEAFSEIAARFVPRAKPYSRIQARLLAASRITKSLRSEYDHLMLQIHDGMKSDADYQRDAPQVTMPFAAGSAWVCFSDQASHAVMSGQFMMEQTFHLPVALQYDNQSHPLAILTRLTGRTLI